MKITLAEANSLKKVIKLVNSHTVLLNIYPQDDRILINGMDKSKALIFHFEIMEESCVEFDIQGDDEPFAVNSSMFSQVLNKANSNQTVTLDLRDSMFHIGLRDSETYDFWLPLIDVEEVSEVHADPLNTILISSEKLRKLIENTSLFSEALIFEVKNDELFFKGQQEAHAEASINSETEDVVVHKLSDKQVSKYSADFLKTIVSTNNIMDRCKFEFTRDEPLIVRYEVPDKMVLTWTLAPRVEA